MKYIPQYQIEQIFKTVSYNAGMLYKTPKKPTDELVLNDSADRYLTRLSQKLNADNDEACISGKLMNRRAKRTPIISEIKGIDTKDIPIIVKQYAQNDAESRLETKTLVKSVTRGDGGEKAKDE